jgi:hypothetical protein
MNIYIENRDVLHGILAGKYGAEADDIMQELELLVAERGCVSAADLWMMAERVTRDHFRLCRFC